MDEISKDKNEPELTGLKKIKKDLKEFHTKKPYIEFFTALLTIPVLITVIYLNINNIKGEDKNAQVKGEDKTIIISEPSETKTSENKIIVTEEACKPGIGDVTISSPEEGANLTDNPVFIDVDYSSNGYCNIVWSYSVNGGEWSNFDDRSIALYNLEPGEINVELRVKSVVNSDTKTITRMFSYSGESNKPTTQPSLTPAPNQ